MLTIIAVFFASAAVAGVFWLAFIVTILHALNWLDRKGLIPHD